MNGGRQRRAITRLIRDHYARPLDHGHRAAHQRTALKTTPVSPRPDIARGEYSQAHLDERPRVP